MDKSLFVSHAIFIDAAKEIVWKVLTKPEKIKLYLYGTEVATDWKIGSNITFTGDYQGKRYIEKGYILANKPYEFLQYSYLSSFSQLADKPEHYATISYYIKSLAKNKTEFTWHQRGFKDEAGKCHTEQELKKMLETIKKLAEQI